ncbi:MAG: hypothetical protein ACOX3T_07540 [Bdellovibrionota bacterium]|jgi:hypothetical protein
MKYTNNLKHNLRQSAEMEFFPEYAEKLRLVKKHSASIRVCLEGLSKYPSVDRGRLVLARTYYDCGYVDFALKELLYLNQKNPDNIFIKRLITKFSISKKISEVRKEGNYIFN